MTKVKFQSNVKGVVNFTAQFDDKGMQSKMNIECKGNFTEQEYNILIVLLIAKFSEHVQQQMGDQFNKVMKQATKDN
jgi:hypothetical protein